MAITDYTPIVQLTSGFPSAKTPLLLITHSVCTGWFDSHIPNFPSLNCEATHAYRKCIFMFCRSPSSLFVFSTEYCTYALLRLPGNETL